MTQIPVTERSKPKLPYSLYDFKEFYDKLGFPLGPTYLGNYRFAVSRLRSDDIEDIKVYISMGGEIEYILEELAHKGVFVQPEAITRYFGKEKGVSYWPSHTPSQEMSEHKIKYNIGSVGSTGRKKSEGKKQPKDHFKDFITFLLTNHYSHCQIAKILEVAPPTIRIWANSYGFRNVRVVRGRVPDLTGKVNRVQSAESEKVQYELFSDTHSTHHINHNNHTMMIDRSVPEEENKVPFKGFIPIPDQEYNEYGLKIVNDCGLLKEERVRLLRGLTWQHIAKRLQNPSLRFLVMSSDGKWIKHMSLQNVDTHSGCMSLQLDYTLPVSECI